MNQPAKATLAVSRDGGREQRGRERHGEIVQKENGRPPRAPSSSHNCVFACLTFIGLASGTNKHTVQRLMEISPRFKSPESIERKREGKILWTLNNVLLELPETAVEKINDQERAERKEKECQLKFENITERRVFSGMKR